jgi:hypothetical protein
LQLLSSFVVSTHAPAHGVKPPHAKPQFVPSHVGVPWIGAEHIVQVAPHALTSLVTHIPPQKCVAPAHWHVLLTQCLPPVQASPHPLQLLSSFVVLTHAPPHGV